MLSERSPFPSSGKRQGKPTLPGPDCFWDEQSQEQPWLPIWEGTSAQAATGPSSQAVGGWLQQTEGGGVDVSWG